MSDLIGNPVDAFSYDAAHFNSEMKRATGILQMLKNDQTPVSYFHA